MKKVIYVMCGNVTKQQIHKAKDARNGSRVNSIRNAMMISDLFFAESEKSDGKDLLIYSTTKERTISHHYHILSDV